MPRLEIALFGTPTIAVDAVAATLERHKPVALLAYLAVTGKAQPRSSLALLFWPESANARTHLRGALLHLRRELVFPVADAAWTRGQAMTEEEMLELARQVIVGTLRPR